MTNCKKKKKAISAKQTTVFFKTLYLYIMKTHFLCCGFVRYTSIVPKYFIDEHDKGGPIMQIMQILTVSLFLLSVVLSPCKNASSLITNNGFVSIIEKKCKIVRYENRTCGNKFPRYPFVKLICSTLHTYYSNEHKTYAYTK